MATRVVGDIAVRIGADARNLNRGLQDAGRRVERFGSDAQRSAARVGRAAATAITAAVALATGIAAAANRAITALDNIGKTADKLGVTTGQLQQLRFAAESAGVASNTLDMAVQRFTRRVAEAAQGTGEAKAALEQMGITLTDSNGNVRDTVDLLEEVADVMRNTTDEAERIRLAFKLFDSEGVAMVNMLNEGSGALRETMQAAQDMGAVIDDAVIRRAEEARDAIDRDLNASMANFRQIMALATPLVEAMADGLRRVSEIALTVATNIASAAERIGELTTQVGEFLDSLPTASGRGGQNRPTGAGGRPGDPVDLGTLDLPRRTSAIRGGPGSGFNSSDPSTFADLPPTDRMIAERGQSLARAQESGVGFTGAVPSYLSGMLTGQSVTNWRRNTGATGDDTGGSGGGGPLAGIMVTEQDLMLLEQRHATALEIAQQNHEEQMALVQQMREQGIGDKERLNDLEARMEEEHARRLLQIREQMERERLGAISNAFGDLASLMQSGNERLFKVGRAAAIAQAVVDGYQAAVSAWRRGMQVGGPGLAAAFAAASLARTGVMIAKIKAQQPSGGSGSQSAGGGAGGAGGGSGRGDAPSDRPARPAVSLTLIGDQGFSRAQIVQIAEALNDAGDDGQQLVQIRGRR